MPVFNLSEIKVIPADVYDATIKTIAVRDNDRGSYLSWTFDAESKRGNHSDVFGATSTAFTTKSKLFEWASTVLDRTLTVGEPLDTDTLIGRRCRIVVDVKKGDDGKDKNTISKVLRADAPSSAPKDDDEPF